MTGSDREVLVDNSRARELNSLTPAGSRDPAAVEAGAGHCRATGRTPRFMLGRVGRSSPYGAVNKPKSAIRPRFVRDSFLASSAPIPKLASLRGEVFVRASESKVHQQLYDASAVLGFEIPMTSVGLN